MQKSLVELKKFENIQEIQNKILEFLKKRKEMVLLSMILYFFDKCEKFRY